MGLTRTTNPKLPVTLEEIKDHTSAQGCDADDAMLQRLASAATDYVQKQTSLQFMQAGFTLTLDDFPRTYHAPGGVGDDRSPQFRYNRYNRDLTMRDRVIKLPRTPVVSVAGPIAYQDEDDAAQTLILDTDYNIDLSNLPPVVFPVVNTDWPGTIRRPANVSIPFVAGYGAAGDATGKQRDAVPDDAKTAILGLCASWYANREAVVTGTIATTIPLFVNSLINSLKVRLLV